MYEQLDDLITTGSIETTDEEVRIQTHACIFESHCPACALCGYHELGFILTVLHGCCCHLQKREFAKASLAANVTVKEFKTLFPDLVAQHQADAQ